MNFIKGNQNPVIGVTTYFEVLDLGLGLNFTSPNNLQYVWYIYKKGKNGTWENITEKDGKTGTKVPYKFGDIAIGVPFKLEVHKAVRNLFTKKFESSKFAILELLPTSNKNYSIQKVVLFNNGAKDPNKATYKDSLIARAYCVSMFNKEVEFQLWEDDAPKGGHNPEINKHNKLSQKFLARVNEKGIAEAKISLLSNEKVLRSIANKYLSAGDKTEGANHEFYVTATYGGKIQGASQVNVDVANSGSQPKRDSAIFSGNSNQASKSDKEGKVTHAYFIDSKGNPTQKIKVGDSVKIRVKTVNMIDEYIQYIVWEKDTIDSLNDEIFRSPKLKITADTNDTPAITITQDKYNEGIDGDFTLSGDPDKDQQQYYIEIVPLNSKAKSVSFGIDDEDKRTKVDNVKSAASVKPTPPPNTNTTCVCKEQYKDLIWGGKVSCEFRQKVVQICKELWGPGRGFEMANGLMAVIKVETWGSFKAHHREGYKSAKDNPKDLTISSFHKDGDSKTSRAIGLIQFTQEALEGMGEFPKSSPSNKGTQPRYDALNKLKLSFAQMGEINQLNKVKKYFENQKNKMKTPEDIYLAVFAPSGVGQKDDFLLYAKGTDEYINNESVDKDNNGIQRKEILTRFHKSFDEGSKPINKTQKFTCGIGKSTEDKITVKDIVTYHIFAEGKIEKHIPKQIKSGYEQKYKYVYHDKNNKEHNICTTEWHETMEKMTGTKPGFLTKHSKIIEDKTVSEGQTQRRVKYENGDVAEYGYNKGKHFWNLYAVTGKKIELVKMPPEGLNYNAGDTTVKYKFSGTERKYTCPGALAGFIGALAECGFSDVITTGSCFREGTCFPSVKHVNGESIDTKYMNKDKEAKFVKAMANFKFNQQITGLNKNSYPNTSHRADHEDHLHSGFDVNSIIIIPEK